MCAARERVCACPLRNRKIISTCKTQSSMSAASAALPRLRAPHRVRIESSRRKALRCLLGLSRGRCCAERTEKNRQVVRCLAQAVAAPQEVPAAWDGVFEGTWKWKGHKIRCVHACAVSAPNHAHFCLIWPVVVSTCTVLLGKTARCVVRATEPALACLILWLLLTHRRRQVVVAARLSLYTQVPAFWERWARGADGARIRR